MRKTYGELERELAKAQKALRRQRREATTLAREVRRLDEANRSFQAIFDAIADPIFLKDEQHRWVLFNQAFCTFLGHPAEELLNQSDYAFFPREQADVFWEMDEQVFQSGQGNVNEEKLTNAQGRVNTIVTKKTLQIAPDGSKRLVGIIRDVTEQKRAEDGLKLHQDIVRNLMEGLFAFRLEDPDDDRTLRLIATNPAAMRQSGVDFEHDLGRTLDEMLPGLRALGIVQAIAEVARGARPDFEDEVVYGDDRVERGAYTFKIFPLPAGCVGGTFVNVTARKQTEADNARHMAELKEANRQLQESERYKDEFFSVISHELRTPLNFIIGFASILEDEVSGSLTSQQHEEVAKILVGADRMLTLVTDLLDMSRIQAGRLDIKPRPTRYLPLVEEVRATMQPLADEKGITLSSTGEADAEVLADGGRIIQVLTNLLGNAIKFTPVGGRVWTRSYVRDSVLVAEVGDTGPGISPEQMTSLFKRFQQLDMSATREAGGTGLGLAISKALVEAHGGTIGVLSEPGVGSTFWLTLPLSTIPLKSSSGSS